MSANPAEKPRTVLVSDDGERGQIVDFVEALRTKGKEPAAARARLLAADGRQLEIPEELYDVLVIAAETLKDGRGITVVPQEAQLTTQQAADFLGMSRPSLVKLLDAGVIAHTKVGRHRKTRLADLIAFQELRAQERSVALAEMARLAREGRLYETTAGTAAGIR